MALVQEPEVQFAQRLASNEKPVRTKAVKKLRKYINVRSQKATGGFTGDELLKLWKGLFYCLWMQDKPLLQEELSNQISSLLHSFHNIDGQLLYLESFLQTFKREWTGIDRLRMDKFYQLVRFMFRQAFEMLKRKNWDSSVIGRFLDLLTAQLLHSSSAAPSGLQFHVLDLYMTELAAVGSAELTADQNLTFIEPFCKTAARTKDRILFRAICNSVFSAIIDQAPFAIADLMKEIKAAEASDSDSGQASEDGDDDEPKTQSKAPRKTETGRHINGKKSHAEEEEEDDDEDEDDELHLLEDSDSEMQCDDDDVGPVLQFDYRALADRLFELASRSNTPSQNRQRLYKIIKVLRDLSEGIFPQDEYPEEVSTDEEDDMFGSRKRMKRRGGHAAAEEEEEDGAPASKKSKGKKKEASSLTNQNTNSGKDSSEPADMNAGDENKKKKKKRKKKKARQGEGEEMKEAEGEQIISSIKVTDAKTETLLLSEVNKPPSVTVIEETGQSEPSTDGVAEAGEQQTPVTQEEGAPKGTTQPGKPPQENNTQSGKKKKKKKKTEPGGGEVKETQISISSITVTDGPTETLLLSEVNKPPSVAVTEETGHSEPSTVEAGEQQQTPVTQEEGAAEGTTQPETPHEDDTTQSGKKKKKKKKAEAESQVEASEEVFDATTPGKKKKKGLKKKSEEAESQVNGATVVGVDTPTTKEASLTDTTTPAKKKSKKNLKAEADEEASQETPAVKKTTDNQSSETQKNEEAADQTPLEASDKTEEKPLKKKKLKNESKSTEEEEAAMDETKQVLEAESNMTPAKKKKKKRLSGEMSGQLQEELPLDESHVVKKKKRKIPVVFEFEADEIEAAAAMNGVAEEETAKKAKVGTDAETPHTPLSTKKSRKKVKNPSGTPTDFISFQNKATVPTPLFCKTKGSKTKCLTPKSGSKKVTFGLKNNKTAEFRKTDRSLLLSPDGSSRVPFDPEQKPKCGVLKSPPTPVSKKTPTNRKKSSKALKSTPKRRPSAADFF